MYTLLGDRKYYKFGSIFRANHIYGVINFNFNISQYPVTFVVNGEVFLIQYILVHVVGSCTQEECIMDMHVCLVCACAYCKIVHVHSHMPA